MVGLAGIFGKRLPEDPGFLALRRATRAAVVIPPTFAFAKLVVGDIQTATFSVFGCFALLVMADLGGMRRPRAAAYIGTAIAGGLLVIFGTLASSNAWLGASVMLLVGCGIQFAGVFGSYVAATQTTLQLFFVLSVAVPAPASAIGSRLAGVLIAGTVSTLAGVFFWPRFERLQLHRTAAEACRALARLIAAQHATRDLADRGKVEEAARAAVAGARKQYSSTPKRPAGPARRDRAFAELLVELERTLAFATLSFRLAEPAQRPCIKEGDLLAAAVVQTVEGSAAVLTDGGRPDLLGLERARVEHRRALDRWAAKALSEGTAPETVLAGLDADHGLRVVSYLALAIGANAIIASGQQIDEELRLPAGTPREGRTRPLIRIARTIRTHLTPSSALLRQSLRVGIGLALAVLLARLLNLNHGFWVVLATLSVLRSNAFGTGRSTVEALAGTAVGFVVGALFASVAGNNSTVLWIAFPIVVFLATYAASTIGFVVGQAAFTLLIIILFNLITPVGWQVGLVRIEDVAVGVGISLVTGLLLWPRGARAELVKSLAGLYRSSAAFLATSFGHVLESGSREDVEAPRRLAVGARERAGEAFNQFINERGSKPLSPDTAGELVAGGTNLLIVGDLLNLIAETGYQARQDTEGVPALRAQTQLMLANFLRLADRLGGTSSALLAGASVSDVMLRKAAVSSLNQWRDDPASGQSALAVVIAAEWIQQLGQLATDLEGPVEKAVEGSRVPWWR
jgi:uncharacterized membrane protein YccC